jgi:hypothetical protein
MMSSARQLQVARRSSSPARTRAGVSCFGGDSICDVATIAFLPAAHPWLALGGWLASSSPERRRVFPEKKELEI